MVFFPALLKSTLETKKKQVTTLSIFSEFGKWGKHTFSFNFFCFSFSEHRNLFLCDTFISSFSYNRHSRIFRRYVRFQEKFTFSIFFSFIILFVVSRLRKHWSGKKIIFIHNSFTNLTILLIRVLHFLTFSISNEIDISSFFFLSSLKHQTHVNYTTND